MMRHVPRAGALAALISLLSPAAWAHHSFAMFDAGKVVTLTGTVKEFQWTNPHVLLWIVRDPNDGQSATGDGGVLWTIELSTSPGPLSRIGWNKHSLTPGDRITVEINPLRSGEPGGSFKKATVLKTGAVLTTAVPDAPPAATP